MNTEPKELRIHRTSRSEAVRHAARILREREALEPAETAAGTRRDQAATPNASQANATQIDEAFASLSADAAPLAEAQQELVAQITSQLKQIDVQRERLANLLSGLDRS